MTPENERAFEPVKLIDRIEHALGTPVQTLVKRSDEQAFALANGQNLMFCEDAARRLYRMLRSRCDYRAFRCASSIRRACMPTMRWRS